eukprot:13442640-Ditylum_brightwellii.AAC.1
MNPDVTKENYVDLPINISDGYWIRLAKFGVANKTRNAITAVHPSEGPISPVEQETLCVCWSIQNCQQLTSNGGS